MLGIVDCCQPSCCSEEVVQNIPGPPGEDGAPGAAGENGVSAFSFTTDDFVIPPADGATPVTVEVENTSWMAVGEPLFMPDGLFFLVTAIVDSTHVSVVYPDWEANVNAGNTISAGTIVTPSGWQPAVTTLPAIAPVSKYGVGAPYVIDQTDITLDAAEINFGTSGTQRITLTTAGTWLLQARARIDYTGATFAAVRNVSFLLNRQNNTPGTITNTPNGFKTEIITTLTYTALIVVWPVVAYTTALTTDIIRMMAAIGVPPTAGFLHVVEAEIIATYLHA